MSTLPTAEETYTKVTGCVINHKDVKTAMIAFAKLKVKEAIEAIVEATDNEIEKDFITKDLIRNAYSLKNIK